MTWLTNLLDKLSCYHEWEEINEMNTYEDEKSEMPYKTVLTFVCKKCGKFKRIKL